MTEPDTTNQTEQLARIAAALEKNNELLAAVVARLDTICEWGDAHGYLGVKVFDPQAN